MPASTTRLYWTALAACGLLTLHTVAAARQDEALVFEYAPGR